MITVTAYSQDRIAILKKYEAIFNAKKSSLADIEANQRAMSDELKNASRFGAVIRFVDQGGRLPQPLVRTILANIVDVWSRNAIEQKGALKEDIRYIGAKLFNSSQYEGLEKISILYSLVNRINQLKEFVITIQGIPGGNLVTDDVTTFSAGDIQNQISLKLLTLREIVSSWSQTIPGTPEAGRLNLNLYSSKVFDSEKIDRLDYLIALDLLEQNFKLLRDNLSDILKQDFGGVAKDPKSGLTAYEVIRVLDEKQDFELSALRAPVLQLGIARNPDLMRLYYKTQITDLEREKKQLSEKSSLLGKILNNGDVQTITQQRQNGSNALGSPTIIPQFGEAFLDRLIELNERGNDGEFRRKFTNDAIQFALREVEINSRLEKFREYLLLVEQATIPNVETNGISQSATDKMHTEVASEVEALTKELANYADTTLRISQRLDFAQKTHKIIENEGTPLVDVDYYLRDTVVTSDAFPKMLKDFTELASTAGRLADKMNLNNFGSTGRLYRPLGGVELVETRLLGLRSMLLIVGLTLAGFFISLGFGLVKNAIRGKAV